MCNKYPSKVKYPSGITIIVALVAAYSIFAASTAVAVVVIPSWFYQTNLLPPENGMFNGTSSSFATYPNEIVIRNFSSRSFTQSVPPPPSGSPVIVSFNSKIEMEISYNGGATYQSVRTSASNTMQISYQSSSGGEDIYLAEITQMDLSGGDLPAGVLIRESQTLVSTGTIRIKPVAGGYMIYSFFYIYTEVSTDFGMSWWPANSYAMVLLSVNPETIPPMIALSQLLPSPVSQDVSTGSVWQSYAGGIIVIKDIKHKLFSVSYQPPALGGSATNTFNSQVDFLFSTDGGSTFIHYRSPATVTERIYHTRDFEGRATYETEMIQLDISGGDLPAGMMIRESPTQASRGGMSIVAGGGGGGGGAAISSFFDIFTEVSTDTGMTWSPASSGPGHVEAQGIAEVYLFASPNLPPLNGEYVDKGGWFAFYANGIVISNVHQHAFTATIPPPLPGMTTSYTYDEQVNLEISQDGGGTFTHATAPGTVTVQITCRLGGDGITEYYDTEMLELDISGGSLPSFVRIRESPILRASLGRTSERAIGGGVGGYNIESFFDIYTEVSTDGGNSWQPSWIGPATIYLRSIPCKKCGDFDNNNTVDTSDLEEFVSNWLWSETLGQPANAADLNCDGKVNFTDFAILAMNWLQGCP